MCNPRRWPTDLKLFAVSDENCCLSPANMRYWYLWEQMEEEWQSMS